MSNKVRPVAQYSLDGDYIESYPSANSANIAMSGKKGANVYMCARGYNPTAYGYRWIFVEQGELPVKLGPIVPYSKQAEFEEYREKVMRGPMINPKGITKNKKARKKIKKFSREEVEAEEENARGTRLRRGNVRPCTC